MKKLNGMVLVLAGTIGCGVYAAEEELMTPRSQAILDFKKALTDYDFNTMHIEDLMDLRSKIKIELRCIQVRKKEHIKKIQELARKNAPSVPLDNDPY